MVKRKRIKNTKPQGYLTTTLGPTLQAKFDEERILEKQKTGILPSKAAWLKRIICERCGLDLKFMSEK
jgi:hypothetical protein